MKKNIVIVTVGTSVFNPNNVFGKLFNSKKELQINEIRNKIKEVVQKNPEINFNSQISAEITVINSMVNKRLLAIKAKVMLVHSDTIDGINAAMVVKEIIEHYTDNFDIELKQIKQLNMNQMDLESVQVGLFEFISSMKNLFETYQDNKDFLIFSPIGGYKSMTTLSYLVASMYGIESYYQFENSTVLVNLPLIPVVQNYSYLEEEPYYSVIQKFLLHTHFDVNQSLFSEDISSEFINEINTLNYEFYKYEDETGALFSLSPLINQSVQVSKFYPNIYFEKSINVSYQKQIFEKIIDEWRTIGMNYTREDYNHVFEHERGLDVISKKDYNWHLFRHKRINYGNNLRAIYKIDMENANVFIKAVYNHDDYERLINSGSLEKLLSADTDVITDEYLEYL